MNYLSKLVMQSTRAIRGRWNWAPVILNYSRTKACRTSTYCREEKCSGPKLGGHRRHSSAQKCNSVVGALVSLSNGIHIRVSSVWISSFFLPRQKNNSILFMTVNRKLSGLWTQQMIASQTVNTPTTTSQLNVQNSHPYMKMMPEQ